MTTTQATATADNIDDAPAGTTGIRWANGWTECLAVVRHPAWQADDTMTGQFVADPALTGDDDCACDTHREFRAEQ